MIHLLGHLEQMYDPVMTAETCTATRTTDTATGSIDVRCTKPPGHGGQHEGRVGAFPVRWPAATTS
jgi:hypothetical protein